MLVQQSVPPRSNRLLFWSLVALGIVLVLTVALALRRFNRDVSEDTSGTNAIGTSSEKTADAKELPKVDENRDADGYFMLTGFISEMVVQKKAGGKTIVLATVIPDEKTGLLRDVSYRFFLSDKDTVGSADIKGGESVTIHFAGSSSETSYIVAKKVERTK